MTSTPSLPAQIEEAWRSIREVRGILYASKAADFARKNGKESTMTIGARSRLINLEAIFATLQQHERLEAEYAHLSETAGEDYERGVQAGMKLSADHIERLEAVVKAARFYRETVKYSYRFPDSTVDGFGDAHATKRVAGIALDRALAALGTAAPETPMDMPPSNPSEGGDV